MEDKGDKRGLLARQVWQAACFGAGNCPAGQAPVRADCGERLLKESEKAAADIGQPAAAGCRWARLRGSGPEALRRTARLGVSPATPCLSCPLSLAYLFLVLSSLFWALRSQFVDLPEEPSIKNQEQRTKDNGPLTTPTAYCLLLHRRLSASPQPYAAK